MKIIPYQEHLSSIGWSYTTNHETFSHWSILFSSQRLGYDSSAGDQGLGGRIGNFDYTFMNIKDLRVLCKISYASLNPSWKCRAPGDHGSSPDTYSSSRRSDLGSGSLSQPSLPTTLYTPLDPMLSLLLNHSPMPRRPYITTPFSLPFESISILILTNLRCLYR